MRPPIRARWLTCALALLVADRGGADPPRKKKSVDQCVSFDQRDRADEDGVDFVVASSCDIGLRCGIKWSVTCAPGTKKASTKKEAVAFELAPGGSFDATASAAHCGHRGWEIASISWSCDPAPE